MLLMIAAAGILLAGGIFINRFRILNQGIGTRKLGLDDMKDTVVNRVDVTKNTAGEMTCQANSYAELQNALGVDLLDGKPVNHDKVKIYGFTD